MTIAPCVVLKVHINKRFVTHLFLAFALNIHAGRVSAKTTQCWKFVDSDFAQVATCKSEARGQIFIGPCKALVWELRVPIHICVFILQGCLTTPPYIDHYTCEQQHKQHMHRCY
jgi:hypothetical protein